MKLFDHLDFVALALRPGQKSADADPASHLPRLNSDVVANCPSKRNLVDRLGVDRDRYQLAKIYS